MIYGNIIITIWNHNALRITISSSVRLDLWNHEFLRIPISSSINTMRLDLWSYDHHHMEPSRSKNYNFVKYKYYVTGFMVISLSLHGTTTP